jgi:putative ABC transport system permease protein
MQAWWEDVRYAIRTLGRQKLLTFVAALTLALGMGMNTAIFSAVSNILWNTLPHPNAERLVAIWGENPRLGLDRASVSFREAEDWRAAASLVGLSQYRYQQVALRGAGEPQSVLALESSADFFDVLGERAAFGRTFDQEERKPGEHRVAVITEALWRREFGGDPAVIGREIAIDGRLHTLIGVLPPGFNFLYRRAEIFLPLRLSEEQRTQRESRSLRVLARLGPGRSVEQADAELQALAKSIEEQEPQTDRGWRGRIRPLELEVIPSGARLSIQTMFWAVMGVLLIACANIASLLLARGALRQRELAIRAALGAGQGRIVRLLLTESAVLSLLGGALGAVFAAWAIPVICSLAPKDFPRLELVRLNPAALGYTFLLCLGCGLIAGLAPAWLLSRGELARALHEGGRGGTFSRQRLLQGLVAAEIALAMMLMTVTGLLVRSLTGQLHADPGFDKTSLLTATVSLPQALYPQRRQQSEFFRGVAEALGRDARIGRASAVQTLPLGGSYSWNPITIEGRAEAAGERTMAGYMVVLPGYFETMRIPLLAGRDFADRDAEGGARVAILNQTMARRYWPHDPSPLGRRFRTAGNTSEDWITVVGLARDVRSQSPARPPRPEMYLPLAQAANRRMVLVARAQGDPAQAAAALRDAVRSVDRNQPVTQLETMDDLIDRQMAGPRVTVQILGFLSLLALLLATVGIYGVLSYLTAQRTREIGIRVALGAVRSDIVWLVLNRGALLAGLGLAAGAAGAALLTPLVRSLLEGLQPHDPVTFSLSAGVLLLAAILACAFPVWRALRLDPVRVLREE